MTVKDSMAVRVEKSAQDFFCREVVSELNFLLSRKMNENETGQVPAIHIYLTRLFQLIFYGFLLIVDAI
jgi:hypothetical protein